MIASDDIIKKRREICMSCPSLKKSMVVGYTCGRFARPTEDTCGCIVHIKTLIEDSDCPQNKWDDITAEGAITA